MENRPPRITTIKKYICSYVDRRSTGEAGQTQEKLRGSRKDRRNNTREAEEKQKRHKIS